MMCRGTRVEFPRTRAPCFQGLMDKRNGASWSILSQNIPTSVISSRMANGLPDQGAIPTYVLFRQKAGLFGVSNSAPGRATFNLTLPVQSGWDISITLTVRTME